MNALDAVRDLLTLGRLSPAACVQLHRNAVIKLLIQQPEAVPPGLRLDLAIALSATRDDLVEHQDPDDPLICFRCRCQLTAMPESVDVSLPRDVPLDAWEAR